MQGFFTRQSYYAAKLKALEGMIDAVNLDDARRAHEKLRSELQGVMILVYHEVGEGKNQNTISPESFVRQMEAIRQSGLPLLTYDELCNGSMPESGIIVTFDDARLGYFDHALPVLTDLAIPSTMFITPGYLDKPDLVPEKERFSRFMSWNNLEKAGQSSLVKFACHSLTHPDMSQISLEACIPEIHDSRLRIMEVLGVDTQDFAYPYGKYTAEVEAAVLAAGYRSASTILSGPNSQFDSLLRLRRTVVLRLLSQANFSFLIDPEPVHRELNRLASMIC